MKNVAVLLSVLATGLVSASAMASPDARFAGACADASFDASGNDIEYFDLGLDIEDGGSKECVITTTLPGKRGLRINVSNFKAEAFAVVDNGGIATLLVNHRFNGQTVKAVRAVAQESGALVAEQFAVGISDCGDDLELRTKLTTKAVKATLLQDAAASNTVSYRIAYVPCS